MAKRKNSVIRRIVLLAVCVCLLYSLGNLQTQLIKQRREYNALTEQKNIKSQQVEALKELLENGTDAELIEKAARERLGYVYPDEQVFVDISG